MNRGTLAAACGRAAGLAKPRLRRRRPASKYEGTRLGRQELNAELLEDVPGALWNRALIEAAHLKLEPVSTNAESRGKKSKQPHASARRSTSPAENRSRA